MPSQKDQPKPPFYEAVTARILENPLENETAASRLKQIGLMIILKQMADKNVETTVTKIIEMTGLSRPATFVLMKPLTDRGLLVEETVLNSQGRGRATRFVIGSAS